MLYEVPLFMDYLREQKNAAASTIDSYSRDLRKLEAYLESHGIKEVEAVTETNLNSFILYLEKQGLSTATVSRSVASMKAFFHYAFHKHLIADDPTERIKAPRIEKKTPGILSREETMRLLQQASGDTPKALRDRAMLELLYETGMRVSELISIRLSELCLNLNYVVCSDGERERVNPFGDSAKQAMERYLENGREALLKGKTNSFLFVNCSGGRMSRQGFWKLVKQYASRAGIDTDITPQTLSHSFSAQLHQAGAVPVCQNSAADREQRTCRVSHPL